MGLFGTDGGGGQGIGERRTGKSDVSRLTLIREGSESAGVMPPWSLDSRDSFLRFSSRVTW